MWQPLLITLTTIFLYVSPPDGRQDDRAAKLYAERSNAVVFVQKYNSDDQKGGFGAGSIINKKGLVVTNEHVVRYAQRLVVRTKSGKTYNAKLLAANAQLDLALIQMEGALPANLPVMPMGDSDKIKIGQNIFVIGHPRGLEWSLSKGIIGGIRKNGIQYDAATNPGNSGGPALNYTGSMIGIHSFAKTNSQNLNFAKPVNRLKKFISDYRAGRVAPYAPPLNARRATVDAKKGTVWIISTRGQVFRLSSVGKPILVGSAKDNQEILARDGALYLIRKGGRIQRYQDKKWAWVNPRTTWFRTFCLGGSRIYAISKKGEAWRRNKDGKWKLIGSAKNNAIFSAAPGALFSYRSSRMLERYLESTGKWDVIARNEQLDIVAASTDKVFSITREGQVARWKRGTEGKRVIIGGAKDNRELAYAGGYVYSRRSFGGIERRKPESGGKWRSLKSGRKNTRIFTSGGDLYAIAKNGSLWRYRNETWSKTYAP